MANCCNIQASTAQVTITTEDSIHQECTLQQDQPQVAPRMEYTIEFPRQMYANHTTHLLTFHEQLLQLPWSPWPHLHFPHLLTIGLCQHCHHRHESEPSLNSPLTLMGQHHQPQHHPSIGQHFLQQSCRNYWCWLLPAGIGHHLTMYCKPSTPDMMDNTLLPNTRHGSRTRGKEARRAVPCASEMLPADFSISD